MNNKQENKKAFTLIELAISLIVIGIIIAAVMSGGDVIKSADTKQFYQNFARKWSTTLDGYYDRMGKELHDADNNGYFDGGKPAESDITAAGINLSKTITTNQPEYTKYMVDGEFSGYKIVTVNLGSYTIGTDTTKYNFLILTNIPTDIAAAVDRYVDGASDGKSGSCLNIGATLPTNNGDAFTPSAYVVSANSVTNIGIIVEH